MKDRVRITITVDPVAKQIVSTILDKEIDPLIMAIVGNQVALRAIKQHAIEELAKQHEAEHGKSKIIMPDAAESIAALSGNKDAKALQGG